MRSEWKIRYRIFDGDTKEVLGYFTMQTWAENKKEAAKKLRDRFSKELMMRGQYIKIDEIKRPIIS